MTDQALKEKPVARETPASDETTVAIPDETLFSYLFYETTYWLSAMSMTLGFSLRTDGMRHVPRTGPVLFIANHQSFLDPVLVGLAVRRHLSYLARKTLFGHPAFTWLIRMLNAVAIDQDGLGIEGLRAVLRLLQGGKAVVIFPEGERTGDGKLHALQPGIQLLIKRAKAPIVPVGIAGAFDAWPRSRPLPMPAPLFLPAVTGTIAVSVGKPLDAAHYHHLPRQQLLDELFQEVNGVVQHAEKLRRKP